MKSYPTIAIIVPVKNEEKNIRSCLESIFQQNYPKNKLQVIVSDDSSTDQTVKIAKEFPVTIVSHSFSDPEAGKMVALKKVTADLCMYLDADIHLRGKNWFVKMVQPLLENKEITASFTRYYSDEHSSAIEEYLNLDPLQRDSIYQFFSPSLSSLTIAKKKEYEVLEYKKDKIPPAGLCLHRTSLLKKVVSGKRFLELDILVNLVDLGHTKFAYVPSAGLFHHHAKSLRDLIKKRSRNVTKVYLTDNQKRKYRWFNLSTPSGLLKVVAWTLYANSIILPTLSGLFKYIKYKKTAALYEPFVTLFATDIIIASFLSRPEGRKLLKSVNILFVLGFLFCALKGLVFAHYGLNLILDDGANYTNGIRILAGERIYQDFQSFFPPLNDYFVAFLLLFTENIVVLRVFQLIISLVLFPVFYQITMEITKNNKLSVLASVLPFLLVLRPDTLFLYSFFYLGLFLYFQFLETANYKHLLLSGILITTGSLFRIDTGFVFFAAITTTLLLRKQLKAIIYFLLSPAIAWASIFVLFSLSGIWGLFFSQVWTVPVEVTQVIRVNLLSVSNLFSSNFSPAGLNNTFEGWLYVGGLCILFSTIVLLIKARFDYKKSSYHKILTLVLLVAISLPYMLGRMDIGHLTKGGMPLIILGGFVFTKMKLRLLQFFSITAVTVVISGLLAISLWWLSFNTYRANFGSKGVIYLNRDYYSNSTRVSGNTIAQATQFLSNSKNEYVFSAPYMSSLYYLSDKRVPTVYDSLINNYLFNPFDQNYVVEELEKKKVDHIVYDREKGPRGISSAMKDYYPVIDQYIMSNFEVVNDTHEGWLFMKRK